MQIQQDSGPNINIMQSDQSLLIAICIPVCPKIMLAFSEDVDQAAELFGLNCFHVCFSDTAIYIFPMQGLSNIFC